MQSKTVEPPRGLITNIQKFTIHDGPGIRTEVFFKGCPLKCLWCSNPETIKKKPEVAVTPDDCIGIDVCGLCLKACSANALVAAGNKIVAIDRERCAGCLSCGAACPNNALKTQGKYMTIGEVMEVIRQDRSLYQRSGGGVTLSGGDCLLQPDFVEKLLAECQRAGIHTCVESQLSCKTEVLEQILPHTDMMITDLKHMDAAIHRKLTGVSNKQILINIRYLATKHVPLVIRIPVVKGYNDEAENLSKTAQFLRLEVGSALKQLQLLPYRPLGIEKYRSLGMEYPLAGFAIPSPQEYFERIRDIAEEFQRMGIPAVAGTTEKIMT